MIRLTAVLVTLAAAALAIVALRGPATAAAPSRVFVTAVEHRLTLSRASVRRGTLLVQMRNQGEDPHDLQVQRLDARGRLTGKRWRIPVIRTGELGEITVPVTRGRYRIHCTLPGHLKMGMRAVLTVR